MQVFGPKITPLSLNGATPQAATSPVAFPDVVSHTFNKSDHKQLRNAAGRMGGMLNDLLMAEMFWRCVTGTSSTGEVVANGCGS